MYTSLRRKNIDLTLQFLSEVPHLSHYLQKGAFSIAAKTGVPVVPITLEGTGKLMPTGMETILNPGSVRVVIHKPIEGNDAEALCNEARAIISTALDKDTSTQD